MTATTYTRSGSTFIASNRLILIVYTVSIFVSALLLFSVQPLFTKMILPRLGGSPAVWSIAMVFFQSLLLGGYAYAHYLMTIQNRMIPVIVHLTLLIIALLTLPLAIRESWSSPPESGYALWLLGLFAVTIGLPFFALAANNPLLQAWFMRAGHPEARDPYFLYASSNIGSFLALLSYPVLLEPMLSLRMQNLLWTCGYGLLIVLIAGCGVLLLRAPPHQTLESTGGAAVPAINWASRGRWVFLAAVPSGLLIAVTAHISTDVAAAPLLWVLPLSVYLLTWVLVFQARPLLPHRWMLLLQPRSAKISTKFRGRPWLRRRGLPCASAFACTDFKVQGRTLDNVWLDLRGTRETVEADGSRTASKVSPESLYVQLSRARSLRGIRLLSEARPQDVEGNKVSQEMQDAMDRLAALSMTTVERTLGRLWR